MERQFKGVTTLPITIAIESISIGAGDSFRIKDDLVQSIVK